MINNKLFIISLLTFLLTSCGNEGNKHTHTYQFVKGVSATCIKEGINDYYLCTGCEGVFDKDKNQVKSLDDLKIAPTGVHVYDQEVATEKYLKTPADCTQYAIYYKSCVCGASSKDMYMPSTFRKKGEHNFTHEEETEEYDEYYFCNTCNKFFASDKKTEIPDIPYKNSEISIKKLNGKSNGAEYGPAVNYFKVNDDPLTLNNEIAEFLYNEEKEGHFGSRDSSYSISLNFEIKDTCVAPLHLVFSKSLDFSEIERDYVIDSISKKTLTVTNLIPGTHYYKIYDSSTIIKESNVDFVTVDEGLRVINTADRIANMRDIASFKSTLGKVKPGMIYRSAKWDNIEKDAENILLNELNVKTEIDIRKDSDPNTSKHPIEGINYMRYGLTDDYNSMLIDNETVANVKTLFKNVLINKNNYPLDYHCTSGADRTGYLSLLIDGVLGLSDEDIYKDYELTSFFISKRFRSDVIKDEDNYAFDPSGECNLGTWYARFGKLIDKLLLPNYKTADNTISSAIVNFLKTKCEVTDADITAFRNIMIEK